MHPTPIQTNPNRSASTPLLAAALRKEKMAMKKYQDAERVAEKSRRRAEKLFKKFMEAYTARYRSEAANAPVSDGATKDL